IAIWGSNGERKRKTAVTQKKIPTPLRNARRIPPTQNRSDGSLCRRRWTAANRSRTTCKIARATSAESIPRMILAGVICKNRLYLLQGPRVWLNCTLRRSMENANDRLRYSISKFGLWALLGSATVSTTFFGDRLAVGVGAAV